MNFHQVPVYSYLELGKVIASINSTLESMWSICQQLFSPNWSLLSIYSTVLLYVINKKHVEIIRTKNRVHVQNRKLPTGSNKIYKYMNILPSAAKLAMSMSVYEWHSTWLCLVLVYLYTFWFNMHTRFSN